MPNLLIPLTHGVTFQNNPESWLQGLTALSIRGSKADLWLQGQLTCDIREVDGQNSRAAAYCNAKGKVLASLRVLSHQGTRYILLPTQMAPLFQTLAHQTAALSRIQIQPEPQLHLLGIYGAELTQSLAQLLQIEIPQNPNTAYDHADYSLIRLPSQEPRLLIMGQTDFIQGIQVSLSKTSVLGTQSDWELLDIEQGIATIYPQTMELFSPHMLKYPEHGVVSFTKGCYVGQEIIARTHYLGKVKRHLSPLYLDEGTDLRPQPGDLLHNSEKEPIGTVVQAVYRSNQGVALLVVR